MILFCFDEFQMHNSTWIFNSVTNQWTAGPSLLGKRKTHSCFYDEETNTIFVVGGYGEGVRLSTTEKLKLDQHLFWEPATDFPEHVAYSAAVSSKSKDFLGYVAGGSTINNQYNDKIWGLQRSDLKWIEISKRLQIPRNEHTMVNVGSEDIPKC